MRDRLRLPALAVVAVLMAAACNIPGGVRVGAGGSARLPARPRASRRPASHPERGAWLRDAFR